MRIVFSKRISDGQAIVIEEQGIFAGFAFERTNFGAIALQGMHLSGVVGRNEYSCVNSSPIITPRCSYNRR